MSDMLARPKVPPAKTMPSPRPGDDGMRFADSGNMLTIENELKRSFDFVGSGVIDGWTVEKLTENRTDQLTLISSYLNNVMSKYL